MPRITIYHNPRCSKSRQTLQLLTDRGFEPDVIDYLKNPPDVATLRQLVDKLGIEPAELIRKKEQRQLGLSPTEDPNQLLQQMAKHPQIIERPIVVADKKARLGRPPEQVLEIL